MNIAIDFEFKRPSEPDMGLISCALQVEQQEPELFWLWQDTQKEKLIDRLMELKDGIFIGYSIQQAEARCFAALGLDPNDFQWRDIMLEWRWLRNGDNRYNYGKVIVNGFPKCTFAPIARVGKKASKEEEIEALEINQAYLSELKETEETQYSIGFEQAGQSLLDCMFFFEVLSFTQYKEAVEEKAHVRDNIIIKGTEDDIELNRYAIEQYNISDISDLLTLADKVTEAMQEVGEEDHLLLERGQLETISIGGIGVHITQLNMGEWAARLAKYGHRGLPIHRGRLNRLLEIIPQLKQEAIVDWNTRYPDTPLYRLGLSEKMLAGRKGVLKQSPFIDGSWSTDRDMLTHIIDQYCSEAGITNYPKTKTGVYDTSKKVIDRYASGENLLKQYQRHQGHLSALKTYSTNSKGEVEALNYIGSDNKQRPDFGPYGTQTARNGAKAKSLCFLGPHWLRVLIDPEPGMAIVECDYGSEEVFIAASATQDDNMKNAYLSEDVYMYYAQLVGMYPQDLPIPTEEQRSEDWFKAFKSVRSTSKTLNLSMQFGAGYKAVAAAVRDATKNADITDEQGRDWVNEYKETYSTYTDLLDELKEAYNDESTPMGIMLQDHWRMGPDNPSVLSASNLPIQGLGSVILREACKLADKEGIIIVATLHDAITAYCKEEEAEYVAERLTKVMKLAAERVLGEKGMKVGHPEIIRHGELWLHSDRAKANWNKLEKYFKKV